MATATGKTTRPSSEAATEKDLEADIAQIREDIAKLAKQLAVTGEHSYGAARRAASDGADHIKAKGEEAVKALRSNADDLERQVSDAVREKPITSLAIAAGVGFLFALLTSR
jgi:ElaB/YqjD/DUF883 family membrane-anchored ribosome-binding protein